MGPMCFVETGDGVECVEYVPINEEIK